MAVSRAERRWSKEPKIETMLSVMDWLFTRASLICAALSLSASAPAATTPPPPLLLTGIPIFLPVNLNSPFGCEKKCRERKTRERNTAGSESNKKKNTQYGKERVFLVTWIFFSFFFLRNCIRDPIFLIFTFVTTYF